MRNHHRPKRVAILNDTEIFRSATEMFVDAMHGFEVVATGAADSGGHELVLQTRPDLVLLGHSLWAGETLEFARRLKAALPKVRIVLMTLHAERDLAPALPGGAIDAIVAKQHLTEQLPPVLERLFP